MIVTIKSWRIAPPLSFCEKVYCLVSIVGVAIVWGIL